MMIFARPRESKTKETEKNVWVEKYNVKKKRRKKAMVKSCMVETCREEKMGHLTSVPIWPAGLRLPTVWQALTIHVWACCAWVRSCGLCVWTKDTGSVPWRRHPQYGCGHSWAATSWLPPSERKGNKGEEKGRRAKGSRLWQTALDPLYVRRNCPAAD